MSQSVSFLLLPFFFLVVCHAFSPLHVSFSSDTLSCSGTCLVHLPGYKACPVGCSGRYEYCRLTDTCCQVQGCDTTHVRCCPDEITCITRPRLCRPASYCPPDILSSPISVRTSGNLSLEMLPTFEKEITSSLFTNYTSTPTFEYNHLPQIPNIDCFIQCAS